MTEEQQPVWIELDGVSNLPIVTTVTSYNSGSLKAGDKSTTNSIIQNVCICFADPVTVVKVSPEKWMTLNKGELVSDAIGIHKMAERNKAAPEPEKVVVGGLTIDMRDLAEFIASKQPKPAPNTTPRGILTMWNESMDHRLGMWREVE